ncbi:MAG: hypothetical protein ACK59M_17030 [Pseudomonadota bacterium]
MTHDPAAEDQGLVLPRGADGKRSSIAFGRAVFADALRAVDADGAAAIENERDWHANYPAHVQRLVAVGAASAAATLAIARAGLSSARARLRFATGGVEATLDEALAARGHDWRVARLPGRGAARPAPLEFPYRGELLRGDAILRQLDAWLATGRIEPSHAAMVRWVLDHPAALDLSDQRVALLGARAEMGPLPQLARWRAQIVAIDLPKPDIWRRIVADVDAGNATLYAPLREGAGDDADAIAAHGGADLLLDTPGIVDWLCESDLPLTLGAYAYLDGALHVRVSAAMDAIQAAVLARRADSTLAMLATPTDIYAVPAAVRAAAHARFAARGSGARATAVLSRGRLMRRNVEREIVAEDGARYGIADSMVVQQGPSYALAKRLQQWRALDARAAGARVSIHVAPPATTLSVVKNRLLANAYRAAIRFGVEAFEPRTASALMAACLVHDLRNPGAPAQPAIPLAHPLELLMHGAAHGGLWRIAHQPRSVLPLAAVLGSIGLA